MYLYSYLINNSLMRKQSRTTAYICLCLLFFLTSIVTPLCAKSSYSVSSPDKKLTLCITTNGQLAYQILVDRVPVSEVSPIGLKLRHQPTLGQDPKVTSVKRRSVKGSIPVVLGENDRVDETYNEMSIHLGNYSLLCRAYNEGVAYRLETRLKGEIIIDNEIAEFNFKENPTVWLAFDEAKKSMTQWELPYTKVHSVAEIHVGEYAINPCLFKNKRTGLGITVIESDLDDYPGMYLLKSETGGKLIGKWAHYPQRIKNDSKYDSQEVLERTDFIARTSGTRSFPWRGFIITRNDVELLNNDLVYKLAKPQVLKDISWIKGGKTSWEWLHDGELEGDLGFKYGPFNAETKPSLPLYKYYIDFAHCNGFEFVTLDAGWDASYIQELCQYAAAREVKVFVWTYFNFVIVDEPMLDRFKEWGIYGVKVDFISRDDQIAIGWLKTMAERCAEREMMILMHGCPKPTGLHRTYPNIISYEAVLGEEQNKWSGICSPEYRTCFPYLRLLGGAADITPGSLRNKTLKDFTWKGTGAPWSLGTLAQQMAMYVVCHQTLGFVSDAPTEYNKHPAILKFLQVVPTVWNDTRPLSGEIGEYILTARRTGEEWYVGGITNWTERKGMKAILSFLEPKVKYKAYIIKDVPAVNNDLDATKYSCETIDVDHQTVLNLHLAQGGGVVMRIYPVE